jgi:tetratricopeptide (TPR) repeat protein
MKNLKFTLFLFTGLLASNFSKAQTIDDGKRFLYYEKFISAKNVFQQLLTANPANEEAAYWLGQTLITPKEDKDIEGAKAVYQKGLAANANSALLNAGMGHIELLEAKTQQARSHFESAISLSGGKNMMVLDAIGFANADFDSKYGDGAYAIEKLQQATNIKGFKDARIMTDLGDAFRKIQDGGSAQRSYEAALAIDPKYARAKFRLGRIYQSQGRSQEAIYLQYYADAIAMDPNYAPVYFNLYQYFYETDVVKSAAYLDKYIAAKGSDEPNACFLNAQMKFAQGLFAEAYTSSENCIGASTNPYPNLYGLKAYSAYKLADSVNAKVAFDMYFQKQNPAKIGSRDYYTYADVLLKFPGNEALAGSFVEKAVELDSTEAGKVALLKSVASTYEKRQQFADAGEWYKKVLNIKKSPSKTDIYNAAYSFYRVGKFASSAQLFEVYTQKFPEDIFGYYMMGKSFWGIDTVMAYGLANNSFEKAIAVGEAYPDKTKIVAQLVASYKYFIAYSANVEKNFPQAVVYCDKALLIDPADQDLLQNKEALSKLPPPKADAKPVNKAEKVTMGTDGSISTIGKDGSTTSITKEGKVTTVKDGVTTIIENGKVTVIGKDGKIINTPPPAPATPKPGAQKPATQKPAGQKKR